MDLLHPGHLGPPPHYPYNAQGGSFVAECFHKQVSFRLQRKPVQHLHVQSECFFYFSY